MSSLAVNTVNAVKNGVEGFSFGGCEENVRTAIHSFINGSELLKLPGLSTLVGCLKKIHHCYRWYKLRNSSAESTLAATAVSLGSNLSIFVSLPTTAILILKCYLDVKKKYAELVKAYENMPIAFRGELADPAKPQSWCGARFIERTQKIIECTWILLRTAFEFAMILEDARLFMTQEDKTRFVACVELAENIDEYFNQGTEEIETLLGYEKGHFQKLRDQYSQQLKDIADAAEKTAREVGNAAVEIVGGFEDPLYEYHPMGPQEFDVPIADLGVGIDSVLKATSNILVEASLGVGDMLKDTASSVSDIKNSLKDDFKDVAIIGAAVLETGKELVDETKTIGKKVGQGVSSYIRSEARGEMDRNLKNVKFVASGAQKVASGVGTVLKGLFNLWVEDPDPGPNTEYDFLW